MNTKQLENDFLKLIEAQKRVIYKVCYVYANDQEELNDLFQEVVLNLWKSFPRYRGDSQLSTWVYRISMNTCITFLRRSSSRDRTVCCRGRKNKSAQGALLAHQSTRENGARTDPPLVGRTKLSGDGRYLRYLQKQRRCETQSCQRETKENV